MSNHCEGTRHGKRCGSTTEVHPYSVGGNGTRMNLCISCSEIVGRNFLIARIVEEKHVEPVQARRVHVGGSSSWTDH